MAISQNTVNVINYLKGINDADVTANDIAEALELSPRQVNGILTGGLQKKGLCTREEVEVVLADGNHKVVKFIKLTVAGKAFDPTATVEAVQA